MAQYDTGTDDQRVRVRPPKSSRPRTKRRPDYSERPLGRVVGVDRGRFAVALDGNPDQIVSAVKARELPRASVVIGDQVRLTGDLTGREGTLARIAQVEERKNVLRRSLEEAAEGRGEKIIVANADLMVIVVAAATPPPRVGMVDRCLVAARESGIPALLCLTKTDLADTADFLKHFDGFGLAVVQTQVIGTHIEGIEAVQDLTDDRFSVLIGHSGVGKSTLINELAPEANRAVGVVNEHTGKGRHTSTSAVALPLAGGGWIVDTPGVRSFGLGHVSEENVLDVFPGVAQATELCLPNCSHAVDEPSCAIDSWVSEAPDEGPVPRTERAQRARALLEALPKPDWDQS